MERIKLSDIRAKFPMYGDRSNDELLMALHRKYYADVPPGQFYNAIEYDTEREDPLKDSSWGERAFMNFQAGVDNLKQGGKQLLSKAGVGTGPTDAEIDEKRRLDENLAEATTGGKVLQIAGETLPTMVLPAGAVGAAATKVPMLARTLAAMGPVTKTMLAGATGAAGGAALSPVKSDESRAVNMGIAGMVGATLPVGLGVGGHVAGETYRTLTNTGAAKRAREFVGANLPEGYRPNLGGVADEANINVANPSGYGSRDYSIPHSAAQATGDPHLAGLEAWSRSRPGTTASWTDFDSARNAGLYRATQDMAPSDLRMSRLEAVRAGRTGPLRERALEEAAQSGNFAEPVLQHVNALAEGASGGGANPAVSAIVRHVEQALGPNTRGAVTPERLYEVRKTLSDKLAGKLAMGDELGAAVKTANRETMGVIKAIDKALDDATGGQWTPYLSEYTNRSKPITSGKVLRTVGGEMSEKPLKGSTPEVTYAGYKRALDPVKENTWGSALTPSQDAGTRELMESLRRAEGAARTRKLAATMGGGSITNTDQQLANLGMSMLDKIMGAKTGLVGKGLDWAKHFKQDAVEAEIARLLQQPTQLAAALQKLPPDQRMRLITGVRDAAMAEASAAAGAGSVAP